MQRLFAKSSERQSGDGSPCKVLSDKGLQGGTRSALFPENSCLKHHQPAGRQTGRRLLRNDVRKQISIPNQRWPTQQERIVLCVTMPTRSRHCHPNFSLEDDEDSIRWISFMEECLAFVGAEMGLGGWNLR
jgi:hypothetical protein